MVVYYDEGLTYADVRLHPYCAKDKSQSGYIDFKIHPGEISKRLEDFKPYADREAIQQFYRLIAEITGSNSKLDTCDCAFRAPAPHKDLNSHLALSAHGRLYLMYRNLEFNCSSINSKWLCDTLMAELNRIDTALPASNACPD